jgi:hypothetical protein
MRTSILNFILATGLLGACGGSAVAKPLKVFILAGQSNMQGHAKVTTFEHMALDPATVPLLREMRDADGAPYVCEEVWITSIGSSKCEKYGRLTVGYGAEAGGPKMGPEFTFGITMEKLLNEPVLIIKTAWGGKSLHTDFRPPSAGIYQLNAMQKELFAKRGWDLEEKQAEKDEVSGHYYGLMIEYVENVLEDIKRVYPEYDSRNGYELAGFVWFQGWNDMVDGHAYPNRKKAGGYDMYSELLAQFIRDVRQDLAAPTMPFVIGVMGVGGVKSEPDPFRLAMAVPASLPDFKGNVSVVLTENYWDPELGALDKRWEKVKNKSRTLGKNKSLSRAERTEALEKFKTEWFSPEELKLRELAISNGSYHYLGSAKIMAQIGEAFAESMAETMEKGNYE